jgi:hypothetical protein
VQHLAQHLLLLLQQLPLMLQHLLTWRQREQLT